MKIREKHVATADKSSAVAFFEVLKSVYPMQDMEVLDAFARNGELTVSSYCESVKKVDCWELSAEHTSALMKLPYVGEVNIGCSYEALANCTRQYDMVVIDTPQGLHTNYVEDLCCEHFNFLPHIGKILKDDALVVLYVNKNPYNAKTMGSHGYDEYDEYNYETWMKRRGNFYDAVLVSEEKALAVYRELMFEECGFVVQQQIVVPCFSDVPGWPPYAFRLGLSVRRVTK